MVTVTIYTTNGLGHLLAEDLAYRGPSPRPRGEALGGLGPCPRPRPLTSRVLAIFQNYEIKKSCIRVITIRGFISFWFCYRVC